MRVNNRIILLTLVIITLLLLPAAAFSSGALQVILGLPVVLFIPGYVLLSALFPDKGSLSGVERIAFSIGLSIAIAVIIGVILHFTPWGIALYPLLISFTVFIIVVAFVAWHRSLQSYEELGITINIDLSRWREMAGLDKTLSLSLVIAVLIAMGSISYVIAVPKQQQLFTEFYILNTEGKAEDYPKQVVLGKPVEINISIVNHEDMVLSYMVDIRINGIENSQVSTEELANGDKWQEIVSFIPQSFGVGQKVEFWLYRTGEAEPCLEESLYLYLDVTEPSQ
jgi:uncharacterized membrane protein